MNFDTKTIGIIINCLVGSTYTDYINVDTSNSRVISVMSSLKVKAAVRGGVRGGLIQLCISPSFKQEANPPEQEVTVFVPAAKE